MKLAWGAKVSREFCDNVIGWCTPRGIDPSEFMSCVAFESGRTFSPSIQNPVSKATGLIQFMPSTAVHLGTTIEQLADETAESQLTWVWEYFRPYVTRLRGASLASLYMAILWPKAIDLADSAPLFSRDDAGSRAYMQNRGLDINSDGVVTKAEAAAKVAALLAEGLQPGNSAEIDVGDAPAPVQVPTTPTPVEIAPKPRITATTNGETMFPLLLGLLPSILNLFAPRAQAQLVKVTGQPAETVGPFLTDLFSKIGEVVKTPVVDPASAIAATAALQEAAKTNAAAVKEVESHALDYLDKLAPYLDRIHKFDIEDAQQAVIGRDAAAARSLRDPFDVAPIMVSNITQTTWLILGGLVAAMVVDIVASSLVKEYESHLTVLVALCGPLFGQIMKERGAVISYRFDGTPTSNASAAANNLIVQAIPQKDPAQ